MVDIPKKWQNLTWQELRGHAAEMVEDIRAAGSYIGLGVPALPQTIQAFFRVFKCRRCGRCCKERTLTGIALSPEDIENLATELGTSKRKVKDLYTFTRDGHRFLQGPCSFHTEPSACSVHGNRPIACRLYPVNMPVRAPTGAYMLAVDSFCEEGCRVATLIIEWQAAVALGEVPKPPGDAGGLWDQARKWQDKHVKAFGSIKQ